MMESSANGLYFWLWEGKSRGEGLVIDAKKHNERLSCTNFLQNLSFSTVWCIQLHLFLREIPEYINKYASFNSTDSLAVESASMLTTK
jgi:hypothetical protein